MQNSVTLAMCDTTGTGDWKKRAFSGVIVAPPARLAMRMAPATRGMALWTMKAAGSHQRPRDVGRGAMTVASVACELAIARSAPSENGSQPPERVAVARRSQLGPPWQVSCRELRTIPFMTTKSEPSIEIRAIQRGDVFWIEPDESRGSVPGSAHPHVVIQDNVFNHSRVHTVIVCALTSNLKRASEPGNVLLDLGEGGLPRRSVAVVSQVSSVDKTQLGDYLGALSEERVEQILAGLRFQQVSFFGGR